MTDSETEAINIDLTHLSQNKASRDGGSFHQSKTKKNPTQSNRHYSKTNFKIHSYNFQKRSNLILEF